MGEVGAADCTLRRAWDPPARCGAPDYAAPKTEYRSAAVSAT